MLAIDESKSTIEKVDYPNPSEIELYIKREDLLHPVVSGNKYRKLKYNLLAARSQGFSTLLTYGGAFSNHIAAVAEAGRVSGFATIGVIRGDELSQSKLNTTLNFAQSCGMTLHFVSRVDYRTKYSPSFQQDLNSKFGTFYEIPEGGTNALAVKGCEEILDASIDQFKYICCSVGTTGTVAGIINCSKPGQQILGFSALKGSFLRAEISKFARRNLWDLIDNYHFGGYAKVTVQLIEFINRFKDRYNIQLDPIYTGKMMFGICDLIDKAYFKPKSKVLAIHTGGLQGIAGLNEQLIQKKLPIIQI